MGLSSVSKRSEGQNVNGNVYIKVHSVCTDFPALGMDTSVWDSHHYCNFLKLLLLFDFFFLTKNAYFYIISDTLQYL